MIYGVDVSAYQPGFDFAACAREGYDFAFIKATEGTSWRSPNYHDQMARAHEAGLLAAAYHYVRGSDVAGQLANIRAMVGVGTPVILDVEDGAGSIASIRALNTALNEAGYTTPLVYIPRWFWSGHMGSPDLTGLPPNWHSAYVDQVARKDAQVFTNFLARESTWAGFGGIPIAVAQFTSALAVANYPGGRIDGNAFGGTREELAALLGGEVDDMSWDEMIDRTPGEIDKRPQAPAREMLRYANEAAWKSADGVDELKAEFEEFKGAVLGALSDLAASVSGIQPGAPIEDAQLDEALQRTGVLDDFVRTGRPVALTNVTTQDGSQ